MNEDPIDRGPEWRAFDASERERKSRLTDEDLSKDEVSSTTDVSKVTISNRYQELLAVVTQD